MLNLTTLETVEIPLHKLTLWDGNVRTEGANEALDELIASIRSVGLLQSLVVKKASRGTFLIGAGKCRFLALSQMARSNEPTHKPFLKGRKFGSLLFSRVSSRIV